MGFIAQCSEHQSFFSFFFVLLFFQDINIQEICLDDSIVLIGNELSNVLNSSFCIRCGCDFVYCCDTEDHDDIGTLVGLIFYLLSFRSVICRYNTRPCCMCFENLQKEQAFPRMITLLPTCRKASLFALADMYNYETRLGFQQPLQLLQNIPIIFGSPQGLGTFYHS